MLILLQGLAPTAAYLRRYTCETCAKVDTDGTCGPRMAWGEPGAYTCASGLWFCARCSAALWTEHLAKAPKLRAALERVERWKRRELDWQQPRPTWWPDGIPTISAVLLTGT